MSVDYVAHSAGKSGLAQSLRDHLRQVAQSAHDFAAPFGAEEEATLAGLLHDLGKYGDLFQKRLQGEAKGIDHWSAGAWAALLRYQSAAAALAIWGHHLGLQRIDPATIRSHLDPAALAQKHPLHLRLSESDIDLLLQRLQADGLSPVKPSRPFLDLTRNQEELPHQSAQMLDVRMLFSALVDADFLDTARHFGEERPSGPPLQPQRALEVLIQHVQQLSQNSRAAKTVLQMRQQLWDDCLQAAEQSPGIFTLTAPTGAGKTLAMLGFALRHAEVHNLRRIVVVIPYLSIIEQTAQVYRDLLEPHFGEGYVIEHHSLSGTGAEAPRGDDQQEGRSCVERLLAENWDAPVVVTTSVQMLESLFSNSPSACRKLHRLARSVILFDEVQTLPLNLVVPTLQALSRLASRYGSTIVFATATQPAFDHLHQHIAVSGTVGWQPREIAKSHPQLFQLARRTQLEIRHDALSWEELAQELTRQKQALCVLNVKRHAASLARLLQARGIDDGLYHLSTNMCPAHRQEVLQEVRRRLEQGKRCLLISTQCVEAGVDVDFPTVYRAYAPLDSIAQAAGRCNRNGKLSAGRVVLFTPEEEKYPPGAYQQAASVTQAYLKLRQHHADLYDPALYTDYYRLLYDLTRPEAQRKELQQAIGTRDFVEVAKLYRLIPETTVNVLVPYDPEAFDRLAQQARQRGLSARWIRDARVHLVSVYRPRPQDDIRSFLEPIPLRGQPTDDWFIYTEPSHYDPLLGLQPQQAPELWIL